MHDSNNNTLHNGLAVPFGLAGSGLLPHSLIAKWADEQLPAWVAKIAGFPEGATFAEFRGFTLPSNYVVRERLCRFADQLIRSRRSSIELLSAVQGAPITLWLHTRDVPWTTRTRNTLAAEGLAGNFDKLVRLTFGDLLRLPGIGVRSVLDFAVTLQSALDAAADIMDKAVTASLPPSHIQADESAITTTLRQLAGEPWATVVSAQDPRFFDLLSPFGRDVISDLVEASLSTWDTVEARRTAAALGVVYPGLKDRATRISIQRLEEQLLEFFQGIARLDDFRFHALLKRFGWAGRRPVTLEEAGQSVGLTRERIRQLETTIRRRLPTHPVYMPALQRAITALESHAPINSAAAELLLPTLEISTDEFSPLSVIAAASDLGVPTDLKVSRVRDADLVTHGGGASVSQVFVIARRLCGAVGLCSAQHIAEEIASSSNAYLDVIAQLQGQATEVRDADRVAVSKVEQDVTQALGLTKEVKPLGDGWYWMPGIPKNRNRLVNCTVRMLSVTERIGIRRIREGIRRHFKFRNSSGHLSVYLRLPSSDVLRHFYRAHPDFEIDSNDLVSCARALDYRQELGPLEQALVEVLRASPSQMLDRQAIRNACQKRGLNPNSLEMALTYSPVIEHLDLNIWALRGADFNPATLDAMRDVNALRSQEKRVHGFGWTPEGRIWVAARLPEAVHNFVLGAPGPMRRFLEKQKFRAVGEDGSACGFITTADAGTLYGFGNYLRRASADEGDFLVMEFDIANESVLLRLGGDELLDSYESGQAKRPA